MDTKTITELHERAHRELTGLLDLGDTLSEIRTFQMADGSGRWATSLQMMNSCNEEYSFQITTPAPATAPAWAAVYTTYRAEERDSDGKLLAQTKLA